MIAPSIRDKALAVCCGLEQNYVKGRTQIDINYLLYRVLWRKPTIIFAKRGLFLDRLSLKPGEKVTI